MSEPRNSSPGFRFAPVGEVGDAILARKADGRADSVVVQRLVERGMEPENAATLVASVVAERLRESTRLYRRHRKLESILEVLRELRSLRPAVVARVRDASSDQFLTNYYSKNVPVVLEGFARTWPAFGRWSPGFFEEHFGDVDVEVMADRERDPRFEMNRDEHRRTMPLRDFTRFVETSSRNASNDAYIVAHNHVLDGPLSALKEDVGEAAGILKFPADPGRMNLWFGPAGTVTRLHHDTANILLVQITGRKLVKLVPSLEFHLLRNEAGSYSGLDPHSPTDLSDGLRSATILDVELNAGDALFLPVFWWHDVRSMETSISLSCSNFAYPNSFPIYNP